MAIATVNQNHKFNKAIQLLGKAAEKKKAEIAGNLNHFKDAAEKAMEQGGKKIKKAALTVDKTVHKNPWATIGGVAGSALVLGFMLGRLKKK